MELAKKTKIQTFKEADYTQYVWTALSEMLKKGGGV